MRTNFVIYLFAFFFIVFVSCKKDKENNPNNNTTQDLATLTTDRIENIGFNQADVVSTVSKEGRSAVIGMGIAWGKNPNPTVLSDNNAPFAGFGLGTFRIELRNLEDGATYYVRSYAINSIGTAYSEQKVFQTIAKDAPVVTIEPAFEIGLRSARLKGKVTAPGSSTVTERGFVWSVSSGPTLATGNKLTSGSGIGDFEAEMQGLTPGTVYYVKSYAINNEGTGYSTQIQLTTNPPQLPTVTTAEISDITVFTANAGGTITSEGSGGITQRGVVYGTNPNPTVSNSVVQMNGSPNFTGQITNLMQGTIYHIRAFCSGDFGTTYGEQKTFTTLAFFTPGAGVTDIDGNSYPTIIINGKEWMKENLKVSKYRNGDAIPNGLSNNAWQNATTGAYAIYNNNAANNTTYGKLYNWYAVTDSRNLCPAGWHVPTNSEWTTLEDDLGGSQVAGGKLKEVSSLWIPPNTGATNESSFSGLPGGYRYSGGSYFDDGSLGFWWSSTENSAANAWSLYLKANNGFSNRNNYFKQNGFSVRCLRD